MFTWPRSRRASVAATLLLAFVLTVSGCGGGQSRSQATPTSQARPIVEQPAPTATEVSPLTRRDVPPSGVAAQLSHSALSASAPSPCRGVFNTDPGPTVNLFGCSTVPSRCTVCFLDFDPNQDIMFHLFGPEGELFQSRVSPDDGGDAEQVVWLTGAAYREGAQYQVDAVQSGTVRARATFSVQEAPTIRLTRSQVRPGVPVEVILTGFQPGQRVPLHLYRRDLRRWVYLTSLPPAQMDERGENPHYTVNTQPGDPEGTYLLVTEPSSVGDAEFRVRN